MLYAVPPDPRQAASNVAQTEMFRHACELMDTPVESVEIPFEGSSLPGYFFRPAGDSRPRATVLLTGGYDGTCEELYFFNGAAALARGCNVLAFDGPGQGAALLQRRLVMRPDWDRVITPVVDYLVARPDVDPDRIALIGLILGAHLAPRAAGGEHRLAALIADCGTFDLQASFLDRLPGPLAARYRTGHRGARILLGGLLRVIARKPTASRVPGRSTTPARSAGSTTTSTQPASAPGGALSTVVSRRPCLGTRPCRRRRAAAAGRRRRARR
jgi:hypothetical protein